MSLSANLQAYFKLDEASGNASDATGNGYTLTNNGTTTYTTAKINNGADFGTTNSTKSLTRTGTIVADSSPYSFSLWVKQRTEIASGTQIFAYLSTPSTSFDVRYEYNAGSRRISLVRQRNNLSSVTASYTVTMGTADYYHIVGAYTGSDIVLYVNNVSVATAAASGDGTTSWTPGVGAFSIGAGLDANALTISNFASCFVDEVGVWSRGLGTTDTSSLYASGIGNQHPFNNNYSITAEAAAYRLTPQQARIYFSNITNLPRPSSTIINLPRP